MTGNRPLHTMKNAAFHRCRCWHRRHSSHEHAAFQAHSLGFQHKSARREIHLPAGAFVQRTEFSTFSALVVENLVLFLLQGGNIDWVRPLRKAAQQHTGGGVVWLRGANQHPLRKTQRVHAVSLKRPFNPVPDQPGGRDNNIPGHAGQSAAAHSRDCPPPPHWREYLWLPHCLRQ